MEDTLQPMVAPSVRRDEPITVAAGLAPLDRLPPNCSAQVWRVDAAAAGQPDERARQLMDIGFVPGEWVTVLTRAWPGGDPMVVRVGQSRFALRRAEAACVQVHTQP
jgi:ferrous iron transport protein A